MGGGVPSWGDPIRVRDEFFLIPRMTEEQKQRPSTHLEKLEVPGGGCSWRLPDCVDSPAGGSRGHGGQGLGSSVYFAARA